MKADISMRGGQFRASSGELQNEIAGAAAASNFYDRPAP